MKHEPDFQPSQDQEPLELAFARARASFAAGTGVEHRIVSLWLMTWGKPGRKPFGDWLTAWDG